jgi:single-stranded-DNA-specific exonuclease
MGYFLGVERSFLNRHWRARLDGAGESLALGIAQISGQSEMMSRVLAGRGVGLDEVEAYLDPTLRDLMPDPFALQDMEPAIARLAKAVVDQERIAVFGDYDVDGATSSALLAGFLQECGCETIVHIPDRIAEGYGPNIEAIRSFSAKGASLVVTVDCGIVSFEPFALARGLGLDVLVFDHHQAPEILPPALAMVDPNRQDDLSGLGYLCAAGVVFMALVALNRALRAAGFWQGREAPDLLARLDLVALGTVADVVPLVGLNRAFVVKGLAIMRARRRPGLTALLDIAGADGPPRPYHLGFLVGPRINAGGRIGDASLGVKLLMTRDDLEARTIAAQLDKLNRNRQAMEKVTLQHAEAEALALIGPDDPGASLVVAGEGWPPGIVGLIAARLKERFNRPAFALALNGLEATGSGRSVPGVDLGRVVRAAVDMGLLIKGGGHAMAAGVTLASDRLPAFRAFLDERLMEAMRLTRENDALAIDGALSAGAANVELVNSIERAGPFGAGNPEPVFAFANCRLVDVAPVGADHLRLRAVGADNNKLEAIAFRAASGPLGAGLLASRNELVHLAGALTINRYGGRASAQLRVLDAARPATSADRPRK